MKTEQLIALIVLAFLGYFGYEYLKKQNGGSLAGKISAAVGNPATVGTENSDISGWQIPYTQATYMPSSSYIGDLPQTPVM